MSILWSSFTYVLEKIFGSNSSGASHFEETPVFFDLETTGLDTSQCDIVQLSAVSAERTFNAYVFPRCHIHPKASEVTGLTTHGRKLLLHGRPMVTVPLEEALQSFISFLRTFNSPFLVGHNAKRFDAPILIRLLREFQLLPEFCEVVSSFLDTLPLSREMFKLDKYNQPYLVQHFLRRPFSAHNATEDVKALQELYGVWQPSKDLVSKHKYTI